MSQQKQDRLLRAIIWVLSLMAQIMVLRLLPPGEESKALNEAITELKEIYAEPEGNEPMIGEK